MLIKFPLQILVVAILLLPATATFAQADKEPPGETTAPPSWFLDRSEHPDGEFVFVQTEKPFGNPIDAEIALQESCIKHVRDLIEKRHSTASSQVLFDWSNVCTKFIYKERYLLKQYSDEHTRELNRNLDDDVKYYRGYAQLLVTDDYHKKLDGDWHRRQTKNRLYQIALIVLTVLGLLVVVFAYLRLQKLTRGFYTGQLRFVCLAIAVALIIAFVFLLCAF